MQTDFSRAPRSGAGDSRRVGSILAAACALPGVAAAQSAPTEGVLGFKYLYYTDAHEGFKRITVNSPSIYGLALIGGNWSVEGAFVADSLSGATPRWHTSSAIGGASKMSDERTAYDMKVVRYFRRAAIGVGLAQSSENDYESSALNYDLRFSTDDNNTTFTIGYGESKDEINSTGGLVVGERKNVYDYIIGLTHVLTPTDIVRFNYTESRSKGYHSDPYKWFDSRPRVRNGQAFLVQWNHHVERLNGTFRSTYRYYSDSYDIVAHTVGLEYAQELPAAWIVTPAIRYHTQSSAYFYVDSVDPTGTLPPLPAPGTVFVSYDQRLSAFGGVTVGFKVAKTFGRWTADFRYDNLQQKGDWRIGGEGSPGLKTFTAHFLQVGVARRF